MHSNQLPNNEVHLCCLLCCVVRPGNKSAAGGAVGCGAAGRMRLHEGANGAQGPQGIDCRVLQAGQVSEGLGPVCCRKGCSGGHSTACATCWIPKAAGPPKPWLDNHMLCPDSAPVERVSSACSCMRGSVVNRDRRAPTAAYSTRDQ